VTSTVAAPIDSSHTETVVAVLPAVDSAVTAPSHGETVDTPLATPPTSLPTHAHAAIDAASTTQPEPEPETTTPKPKPLSTTPFPSTHGRKPKRHIQVKSWLESNMLQITIGTSAAVFVLLAVITSRAVTKPKLKLTEAMIQLSLNDDFESDTDDRASECSSPLLGQPANERLYQ
jgi:hypothetical protein